MSKGFYFSLEALIALVFLIGLIAFLPNMQEPRTGELYLLQKQHDLFNAWNYLQDLNPENLAADSKALFPSNKVELKINNEIVFSELSEQDFFQGKILTNNVLIYKEGKFNLLELSVLYS